MAMTMLVAKVQMGREHIDLRIEMDNRPDLAFTLVCNDNRRGSPALSELPRRFQTLRGAQQSARLLIGEKIDWQDPEFSNIDTSPQHEVNR